MLMEGASWPRRCGASPPCLAGFIMEGNGGSLPFPHLPSCRVKGAKSTFNMADAHKETQAGFSNRTFYRARVPKLGKPAGTTPKF